MDGDLVAYNLALTPETIEVLNDIQKRLNLQDHGQVIMHSIKVTHALVAGDAVVSLSKEFYDKELDNKKES